LLVVGDWTYNRREPAHAAGKEYNTGKSSWWKTGWGVLWLYAVTALVSRAQTFTTLASFNGTTNGLWPQALSQGTDGNFYGTTFAGGSAPYGGTVFKITPTGTLTMLYSFTGGADGGSPGGALVLATDGSFYGTAAFGGAHSYGTIFKISPIGMLTILYTFTGGADGGYPTSLVLGADGNLYGTTGAGDGTIFEITLGGALTTLYTFHSATVDVSMVVQGASGNFYGTTYEGGAYNDGTVFKMTPRGTLTTLYSFTGGSDGGFPYGGIVIGADGNFYGTTTGDGGAYGNGTVFTLTPAGTLTTLYSFTGRADGSSPFGSLVQANDGNLYGTTYLGGASQPLCPSDVYGFGCGTVFRISSTGALTTLHSFAGYPIDGAAPQSALLQATDGNFYGTTLSGGAYNAGGLTSGYGTVFSLSMGLGPSVKTVPHSGKAGSAVIILGTNLRGASSVSFNGAAAAFSVVSATEITTTVPAGATTGKVQVITPSGTLFSGGPFLVRR